MIHFTEEPTLKDYLAACRRRIWVFAAVVVASVLAAAQYVWFATPQYRAQATVLVDTSTWNTRDYVERADVPEVARVVEMLATRVLSQESLAALAHTKNVFPEAGGDPAKLAGAMRKGVSTEVTGFDQFQVSFVHTHPQVAAAVANELAEKFVSEQKAVREMHGEKTTAVMTQEITGMQRVLAEKSEQIKAYRVANQGALPGQTEGNIRAIERWSSDLRVNGAALQRVRERLNLALASTPKIYQGEEIEVLKAEIAGLESERAQTEALIRSAEAKVAKAAEVEGTLVAMQRDYDSTLTSYNDMLERKQAASLRAELDKSRFETLFTVTETAAPPAAPFFPSIAVVLAGALAFGLLGGAALAIGIDWFDDTFHDAPSLARVTGLPVLATLPRQRRLLAPPANP